jgi:hypothetical protein
MGINDLSDLPELKELGSILEERERAQMDLADAAPAVAAEGEPAPEGEPEPVATTAEGAPPEGAA